MFESPHGIDDVGWRKKLTEREGCFHPLTDAKKMPVIVALNELGWLCLSMHVQLIDQTLHSYPSPLLLLCMEMIF